MQSKKSYWWKALQVMKRWDINEVKLYEIIKHFGLTAYRATYRPASARRIEKLLHTEKLTIEDIETSAYPPSKCSKYVFRSLDIEAFEKEHPDVLYKFNGEGKMSDLSAKDARELAFLRLEKAKWDNSINIAVQIAIFCSEQGKPIIRAAFDKKIFEIDKTVTDTTCDKIWKALPTKYKKGSGRPKKGEDEL